MSVDKFGRFSSLHGASSHRVVQRITFPRTKSGDFDLENHRICNLKDPVDPQDGVHKKLIDELRKNTDNVLKELNDNLIEFKTSVQSDLAVSKASNSSKLAQVSERIDNFETAHRSDVSNLRDDINSKLSGVVNDIIEKENYVGKKQFDSFKRTVFEALEKSAPSKAEIKANFNRLNTTQEANLAQLKSEITSKLNEATSLLEANVKEKIKDELKIYKTEDDSKLNETVLELEKGVKKRLRKELEVYKAAIEDLDSRITALKKQ